jgi:predicted membrane protein DUF2306
MFEGDPFFFQGFEIPSDDLIFLVILSIHVLAGISCAFVGLLAMLADKKRGRHTKCGKIYNVSIWIVFLTAVIISTIRFKEDFHLLILGSVAFFSAFIARWAVKKKWGKWSIVHITGMGTSYIFLLTAFYVDNGKFLPIWKNFSPVVYWLLPAVVGVPIIARTLLRHPLSGHYFKPK